MQSSTPPECHFHSGMLAPKCLHPVFNTPYLINILRFTNTKSYEDTQASENMEMEIMFIFTRVLFSAANFKIPYLT